MVQPCHTAYISQHFEIAEGDQNFGFRDPLAFLAGCHVGHFFYVLNVQPGITDCSPVGFASITVSGIFGNIVGAECSVVIELDRTVTDIITETLT